MKMFILSMFTAITMFCNLLQGFCNTDTMTEYPETFIVVAVDEDHDFITLMDFNGFTWTWYGVDDWMIGDIAAAIMDSNGTEFIADDEIIMLKYSGYLEGTENELKMIDL